MTAWKGDGRNERVFADWAFKGLVEPSEGGWRIHLKLGLEKGWQGQSKSEEIPEYGRMKELIKLVTLQVK